MGARVRTRPRGRRWAPWLAVVLVATGAAQVGVAAPASRAIGPEQQLRAVAAQDPPPVRVVAEDLLAKPARGRTAIRALGDELPEAAALNDLSRSELTTLLDTDPTAWVATSGQVYFREPLRSGPAPEQAAAATPAAAPLADTFSLHSRPGADRVVFLDVDGATVTGTHWNSGDGVGTSHPAWDLAEDGAAFSDAERTAVQEVWAMVAEDFAAFDVDVTTEDPGAAGLYRTSVSDTTYGAHVVITPSDDAWSKICERSCGGVAFLNVFDAFGATPRYQPAWVFTGGTGNAPKGVAEAATHEVGHQLGLDHDGKDASDYYSGHGVWAPIMGSAYTRPVSQWSRGDYSGATRSAEDDLAIIGEKLAPVPDEAGQGVAAAAQLAGGTARITDRDDVDTWALGTCSGAVSLTASVGELGPDLDVGLTLLDAAGALVATADPASAAIDSRRASGMGATLGTTLASGAYYLSVDGVGNGTPDTGYDDYASIGAYSLAVSGCTGDSTAGTPGEPRSVTASADGSGVTLAWTEPESPGDSPVTGYRVTRSGSAAVTELGASVREHLVTGLQPSTAYTFTVRAVNGAGPGPAVTIAATTTPPAVPPPTAPRSLAATWGAHDALGRLSWQAPAANGGSAVTAYEVFVGDDFLDSAGGSARSAILEGFPPGTWTIGLRAVSAAGPGATATVVLVVPEPDARPGNDDRAAARAIAGHAGSVGGTTTSATAETDDPEPPGSAYGAGGSSVWYRWTPGADGRATLATRGRAGLVVDTTLAVYRSSGGLLERVAANDDVSASNRLSSLSLDVRGDESYLVVVDGFPFPDGRGPFTLAWDVTPAQATASALGVAAEVTDRTVRAQVTVAGALVAPSGVVSLREGGRVLGTVTLTPPGDPSPDVDQPRSTATITLPRVQPGLHTYALDYVPDILGRHAASTGTLTVRVDRVTARTTLRLPGRVRARSRPTAAILVGPADDVPGGRVAVTVRRLTGRTPSRSTTLTLRGGSARYRLPVLRPGRVKVTARYLGSSVHLPHRVDRVLTVRR